MKRDGGGGTKTIFGIVKVGIDVSVWTHRRSDAAAIPSSTLAGTAVGFLLSFVKSILTNVQHFLLMCLAEILSIPGEERDHRIIASGIVHRRRSSCFS